MDFARTLGQWLEHWAENTPDKEYIVYSDRDLRFTWSEFNKRVDDMAKGMLAIGITHGTHVGVWATNVPDWLTFLYAGAKIGAVLVTINTNYKQSELEYLVENADIHTMCITDGVFDGSYVDMVYTMLPELKTSQRGYLKSERFPRLRNVVYIGQEKYRGMYNTPEMLLLGQNIKDETLEAAKARVNCHDVVNMQYTSGTTGFPKGVMLTHYNIANNGFLTGEHMKFTADDKLCCCVPLFHCFGVVLASMNVLTHGCTQVMVEKFDPLLVLASIHKERCTAVYGVPTMFIAELNHPMFEMFDLTSLRTGIMAGSLCPVELMKTVEQEDVLNMFEGMAKHLFKVIRGVEFKESFMRMTWQDAMKQYGSDKPDLRFGMKFVELMDIMKGHGFSVFDNAAYIGGICAEGAASYTRKQLDALTEFVKRPQVGAKGLVYARVEADGNVKSSVDKFYSQEVLQEMKNAFGAKPGDLILILSGDDAMKTRKQLCELRLEMGNQLGLRDKDKFVCLWVIDFPLFEWNEDDQRFYAMHHPFTSPNPDDIPLLDTDPGAVRANAYDMVINGVEVGGGSIRIHDSQLQDKMFKLLGFTEERAQEQFGFLMNAFKYGAPPHGGLAYGLDRFVSLFAGLDSIRDCIAFPKNNSGRDVMLDAPGVLDPAQLDELNLIVDIKK